MFFTIFLFLCLFNFLIEESQAKDYVLDLTDETFDREIEKLPNALVMFYAPWCTYCKALKPEFNQAAQNLNNDNVHVNLARINCDEGGTNTCDKYKVDGYPSVKLFKNGHLQESYTGPREAGDIIKYMKSIVTVPQTRNIRSFNEFDKYTKLNRNNVAMGFFKNDKANLIRFLDVGERWRGTLQFVYTTNEDICGEQGVENGVVIFRPAHLHNKFEPHQVTLTEIASKSDISSFLESNRFGLVGHRNLENQHEFGRPLVVAYYDVDYINNEKQTNYWRNRILIVARRYHSQAHFAISNKNEFFREMEQNFDLNEFHDEKHKISILAVGQDRRNKYKMKENFTVDAFELFVEKFLVKEKQETSRGRVKIANNSNFNNLAVSNGKDAVVFLHGVGTFDEIDEFVDIAEILKDEPIDFIKMDMDDFGEKPNWVLLENTRRVAVYFLGKDRKDEPVVYQGDSMGVEKLMKFIGAHATDELLHFDRDGKLKRNEG